MSNYATKRELEHGTAVVFLIAIDLAAKKDFTALKVKVDKLN